jgi:Fic family protein
MRRPLDDIAAKKARLDLLPPLSGPALAQLQKHFDVELTCTSNVIEGNTLSLRETAEVIEHGITVGGKSLRNHLEAIDHYQALLWMRELAASPAPLDETVVCELHRRIVARSQPAIAGVYSTLPRRIAGSPVVFTNPAKIPELMTGFGRWLKSAPTEAAAAFEGHFCVTVIHPFADGNGRTARLMMNLMLVRRGYPPVAVAPRDRKSYLDALETGSLAGDLDPFQTSMHERLSATLDEYLQALGEARPA